MDPSRLPVLERVREVLRGNLDKVIVQRAQYGELDVPVRLLNQERELLDQLERVEAQITLLQQPQPTAPPAPIIIADGAVVAGEAPRVLARAVAEVQQQFFQLSGRVAATTGFLDRDLADMRTDMSRQMTAVHLAIEESEATAITQATGLRASVESQIASVATIVTDMRKGQETWQESETRERRHYQQVRLFWQRVLAGAVVVLCVAVVVIGWRLMQ